eukprot:gene18174-20696_t
MLESPTDVVNPTATEMFSRDPATFQTTARFQRSGLSYTHCQAPHRQNLWFAQPLSLVGTLQASNPSFVARTTGVSNFTDPVLDPPTQAAAAAAAAAPLPQVPPPVSVVPAPSPIAVPPVPPQIASTSSTPPSWLALLLEGRTTPAFISLCEQKLIQQEDFSSAELLASVPESEFNNEYLASIGITAKGLQIKLVNLHKELRAARGEAPSVSDAVNTPASIASVELAAQFQALTVSDDRALDPVQNFRWLISAHQSESKFKPNFSSYNLHPMTGGRLGREIEVIKGPVDIPYESRYFKLDVQCPPNYPFKACRIKFCTEVWHPNVDRDGSICSAMLQEDWSPAYTLHKCLIVIQSMLHTPVVSKSGEAVNFSAAMSFLHDDNGYYDRMVRFMTEAHGLVAPPTEEEIAQWFAIPSQASSSRPPHRIPLFDIPLNPLHGSVPAAVQPLPAEAKRGGFFGFRPFSSRPQVQTTEQAQVARADPPTDARTLAPTAPLGPTTSAHQDLLKGPGNKN